MDGHDTGMWDLAWQDVRALLSEAGMPEQGLDDLALSRGEHGVFITSLQTVITPVASPRDVQMVGRAMAWAYRQGLRE